MMQPKRLQFRIKHAVALVAFLALSIEAAVHASELCVQLVYAITVTMLLAAAILSQFTPNDHTRAWWFGFALFGWVHLVSLGTNWRHQAPTGAIAENLAELLTVHCGPYPTPHGRGPWYTNGMHEANQSFAVRALKLADLFLTLLVAFAGAWLTRSVVVRWLRHVAGPDTQTSAAHTGQEPGVIPLDGRS